MIFIPIYQFQNLNDKIFHNFCQKQIMDQFGSARTNFLPTIYFHSAICFHSTTHISHDLSPLVYSQLVMERTWVRVRNVRLFWSSSSFSSTFGLKSKVRDVRSSEIPKFGCSKFEFLEFVPFRSILGQIYCIETEKFYNFSPT